jgi:flagellar hook-basal body complex protein FliE
MPVEALAGAASEWTMPKVDGLTDADGTTIGGGSGGTVGESGSGSFGGMLAKQLDGLAGLQNDAASASRSLADGTATDPSQVVVAVERAQLAMQLAAQLRTKAVDAVSEVFRTQV